MDYKLRSTWPLLFSTIIVFLIASYVFYLQYADMSGKATFRMIYGILGGISMLFLALYSMRKSIFRFKWGSSQSWLQAHVYIGIISLVLIMMHFEFNVRGTYSIFLFMLYLAVFISGVLGSLIYTLVPFSLTKYGWDVKPADEIVGIMERYLKEAEKLTSNMSDEFRKIYQKEIYPVLQSKRTKWKYLFMEEIDLIDRCKNKIEGYKERVPDSDIFDLNLMGSILIEKERLFFLRAKLQVQVIWLNVHMPLSFALIAVSIVHIVSTIYY
jgi:hypothetical protein